MVTMREFLIFQLANEEYAVDILMVQEICSYRKTIHIANTSPAVDGVMNIAGTLIPVINLRILLKLAYQAPTEFSVIIILSLPSGRTVGIVIDSASDVVKLSEEQIKPTAEHETIIHSDYIQGVGMLDDRILILVDFDKLLSQNAFNALTEIQASGNE